VSSISQGGGLLSVLSRCSLRACSGGFSGKGFNGAISDLFGCSFADSVLAVEPNSMLFFLLRREVRDWF